MAIIEQLEDLKAPDRGIDLEIWCEVYAPDAVAVPLASQWNGPNYTGSLDAAITLVPVGWAWFCEWIGEPFSLGDARVWIPSKRTQKLGIESVDVRSMASPAIALCIASLKALASIRTGSDEE